MTSSGWCWPKYTSSSAPQRGIHLEFGESVASVLVSSVALSIASVLISSVALSIASGSDFFCGGVLAHI
jgi:uncharacterized membrane protein YjgN (DUF898 family)